MIVFNFNIAQASIIPIKADSPLSLIRIEYCPPRVPISFSCRAQIRIPRLKSRSRRRSVVRASYTVIRDYVCSGYYLTRIGQPKNSVAESTWIRRKAFFHLFRLWASGLNNMSQLCNRNSIVLSNDALQRPLQSRLYNTAQTYDNPRPKTEL